MLKIEKTVTASPEQWMIIIEGMRNPKNSWDKIDSSIEYIENPVTGNRAAWQFHLGENDDKLMRSLRDGGSVHAKYRRMIPVWVTLTAPLFWWKEFDTYKVGTVRNSCSTMHKIHTKPFSIDGFSHEGIDDCVLTTAFENTVLIPLENLRQQYNTTKDKKYWRAIIEMLPDSYMMKATLFLNYEVLANMYYWRENHKLTEWHTFCDWIRSLPYSYLITGDLDENAVICGA